MSHSTAEAGSKAAILDADTIPFVQEFSAEVRACLLANSVAKTLHKGERLLAVGEYPECLAIILSGMIELCGTDTDDDCGVLLLTSGDLVTPLAVVFEEPCLTSATALMPTRVLLVPGSTVVQQARERPEVALALARTMGAQWRMAVRHLIDLKSRTAGERLAAFLLRCIDNSDDERTVLPFSKGALAARLGVKPETLSRVIQVVAANGIVLRGSRIILRDRVKAEKFCGPDPYPKADESALHVHAL
jgi:CRP/FNR family transcriptional regulator, transcriptional activator FtrB